MFRKFGLLLVLVLLASACKKDKDSTIEINGKITDANTGQAVSDVTVLLEVQEISNGTFSSSFKSLDQVKSAGDGTFSFVFDRTNASQYRITASKTNYFGDEISINPDDLSKDQANTRNISINSKAWLKVVINNVSPFDANDQLSFQLTQGVFDCGSACCGSSMQVFNGNVHTTVKCLNSGGHNVVLQGFYIKDGSTTPISATAFLTPFDTTVVNIDY